MVMPRRWASFARCSPTFRFSRSSSRTQGPAMRNGPGPKGPTAAMMCSDLGELLRPSGRPAPAPLLLGGADEPGEQRVRPGRTRLELRVELAAHVPRVLGELDHLDQRAVGREAGEAQPVLREQVAVAVVHLVAVAVPLAGLGGAVDLRDPGARAQLARVGAEPHGAAQVLDVALAWQQ